MEIKPLAVALRFLGVAYVISWIIAGAITVQTGFSPQSEWSTFQKLSTAYTLIPLGVLMGCLIIAATIASLVGLGQWIFTGKVEWPFKKKKGEEN